MTRSQIYLWSGLLVGLLYVSLGISLAMATPGFNLSLNALSLLTLGPYGWIQMVNLWLTGLLLIVASLEWKKTSGLFLRFYGLSLILSGIFLPDPAGGFPVGAPVTSTLHGILHFIVGGVGFLFLILATAAMGFRHYRAGSKGRAGFAWTSGIVFLIGFVFMAVSDGSPLSLLVFWSGLILTFVWIGTVQWSLRPIQKV